MQGLGSANPRTEEMFDKDVRDTFFGRAQAIIRGGTEAGQVKVTISSEGLESKEIILRVHEG